MNEIEKAQERVRFRGQAEEQAKKSASKIYSTSRGC